MKIKKIILLIILTVLMANTAWPCTVPVFRYALERWAPDYHIMTVSSRLDIPIDELNRRHHANLWLEKATSKQQAEVIVTYPGSDQVWYEGDWDPSLPDRLCYSPLRREIALELLTGTTATWILLEGPDPTTSSTVFESMKQQLNLLSDQIKLVEAPDYEDELDGYAGPGGPLSSIPLKMDFSIHSLSRENRNEEFLLHQMISAFPDSSQAEGMIAAVIFGQGRMILLSENELLPEIVEEVCYFLCGECSCRMKVLNPGQDLLMAANWNESVIWYPEPIETYLPGGTSFLLGDTLDPKIEKVDNKKDANIYTHTLPDKLLIVLISLFSVLLIIYLGRRLLIKKRNR